MYRELEARSACEYIQPAMLAPAAAAEWPDAPDAMVAAPEHHEVRYSSRYAAIRGGATWSGVSACTSKTLASDHSDSRASALICG